MSLWQIDCEINSLDSIHDTSRERKKGKERKRNQRLATELSIPQEENAAEKKKIKKKARKSHTKRTEKGVEILLRPNREWSDMIKLLKIR